MASTTIHNEDPNYRSSEDEDFVPDEAELRMAEQENGLIKAENSSEDEGSSSAYSKRAKKKQKVDALWKDLHTSTPSDVTTSTVSSQSSQKAQQILDRLRGKKSAASVKKTKKKVVEFKMTTLGVDITRKREDLANPSTVIEEVVKFAGKEYNITKASTPVSAAASQAKPRAKSTTSALDEMVAATLDPKKITTIEKSSIDWDKYKTDSGITEELTQYTKDGYLEKQDFLTRVDHRKFELERQEREIKRKKM